MTHLTFFILTTSNLSGQVMPDEPFIPVIIARQFGVFAVDVRKEFFQKMLYK